MEDPNSAAVANAIQAGANFWGRVQGIRENRMQKQKLGIEQQRTDIDAGRLKLDVDNAAIQKRLIEHQISQADLQARQAQKASFLQSHNPLDSAKTAFGARAAVAFKQQVQPVTDADVAASNQAQLGPDAANLIPNPKAAPGQVKFPMPPAEHRKTFGIPETLQQDTYSMPQADFDKMSPQYIQSLITQAEAEFEKPFDQMSKEAQESVIEAYQKSAPPGVKISDAEAIQAFRQQQRLSAPPPKPDDYGLVPSSGQFDPLDPSSLKLNLTAPLSNESGGNEPYIRVGGELKPNPAYQTPEKIAERKEQVRGLGELFQSITDAENSLDVVGMGPAGGGVTGRTVASVAQLFGSPERKTEQRKLDFLVNKKVLESVEMMKGSLSDKDVKFLKDTAPKLSDPPELWKEYLSRWRGMVENSIAQKAGLIPNSGAALPAVTPPASVSGVGKSGEMQKFNTLEEAEAANLPKGTKVLIFDGISGRYRTAESQ